MTLHIPGGMLSLIVSYNVRRRFGNRNQISSTTSLGWTIMVFSLRDGSFQILCTVADAKHRQKKSRSARADQYTHLGPSQGVAVVSESR